MILAVFFKLMRTNGPPKEIVCDGARIFQANIIQDFVQGSNTEVKVTTPYAHHLARKIEQYNITLENRVNPMLHKRKYVVS